MWIMWLSYIIEKMEEVLFNPFSARHAVVVLETESAYDMAKEILARFELAEAMTQVMND